MKFETITVKRKDGTEKSGELAIPETVKELTKLVPEERVLTLCIAEYVSKFKKKLKSGRSRRLVLKVDHLSYDVQQTLRDIGLLK